MLVSFTRHTKFSLTLLLREMLKGICCQCNICLSEFLYFSYKTALKTYGLLSCNCAEDASRILFTMYRKPSAAQLSGMGDCIFHVYSLESDLTLTTPCALWLTESATLKLKPRNALKNQPSKIITKYRQTEGYLGVMVKLQLSTTESISRHIFWLLLQICLGEWIVGHMEACVL